MADSKMILRVWIGAVAGMALTTTLHCYTKFHFPAENIFRLTPHQGEALSGAHAHRPCCTART